MSKDDGCKHCWHRTMDIQTIAGRKTVDICCHCGERRDELIPPVESQSWTTPLDSEKHGPYKPRESVYS